LPVRPAPIAATDPLRDDSLKPHLAGFRKDDRTVGLYRFAEHNAVDPRDQARKRLSPLLKRPLAAILIVEGQRRSNATREAPDAPALVRSAAR